MALVLALVCKRVRGPIWGLTCLLLLPLAGCSPEYNWREVQYPQQGLMVMLPGKPGSLTRGIELDGEPVQMTMHGAAAGGNSFAVGVVTMADPSKRDKYLAAMRAQMVRNIAGHETAVTTQPVPVVDREGQRVGNALATVVRAEGTSNRAAARLVAGFVGHRDRVLQFVMLGPASASDDNEMKVFMDSLRLVQ